MLKLIIIPILSRSPLLLQNSNVIRFKLYNNELGKLQVPCLEIHVLHELPITLSVCKINVLSEVTVLVENIRLFCNSFILRIKNLQLSIIEQVHDASPHVWHLSLFIQIHVSFLTEFVKHFEHLSCTEHDLQVQSQKLPLQIFLHNKQLELLSFL